MGYAVRVAILPASNNVLLERNTPPLKTALDEEASAMSPLRSRDGVGKGKYTHVPKV